MKLKAVVNPLLTGMVSETRSGPVSSHLLAPVAMVQMVAGTIPVWSRENVLNVPPIRGLKRQSGTAFSRSDFAIGSDTFLCHPTGHEIPVDDMDKAQFKEIDLMVAAGGRARNVVEINHSREVLALMAGVSASSPATKWNSAGSTPIKDINIQREAIYAATGLEPNTIYMSWQVANILRDHPDFVSRYSGGNVHAILRAEDIAAVLQVPYVGISRKVQNTAGEGLALSVNDVWIEQLVIAHVSYDPTLQEPSFARTLVYDGGDASVSEDNPLAISNTERLDANTGNGVLVGASHTMQVKLQDVTLARLLFDLAA